MKDTIAKLETELVAQVRRIRAPAHPPGARPRRRSSGATETATRGVRGVAREQFAGDAATRNALFSRMEFALESYDGHMNEIARDFRRQSDLDLGTIYPFDEILAGYDPSRALRRTISSRTGSPSPSS